MDIHFACSTCGQSIVIDEAGAGMAVQCPGCQTPLVVPQPEVEQLLVLTQLCPNCDRAYSEHERVCDHCGTPLGEPEPESAVTSNRLKLSTVLGIASARSTTPSPARPRSTKPVPASSPPPAATVISPPATPVTLPSASPEPVEPATPKLSIRRAAPVSASAVPQPPPPAPATPPPPSAPVEVAPPTSEEEDQYRCVGPHCGRVWYESQLGKQVLGMRTIPICPHCQLGVTKLPRTISFWASVPRAFAWPFQGSGAWIVGLGAVLLAYMQIGKKMGLGIFLWGSAAFVLGFFGMVFLNVIRTTVHDFKETLDWPNVTDIQEIVGAAKDLIMAGLLVFAPALLCFLIPILLTWFDLFSEDDDYSSYSSRSTSYVASADDDDETVAVMTNYLALAVETHKAAGTTNTAEYAAAVSNLNTYTASLTNRARAAPAKAVATKQSGPFDKLLGRGVFFLLAIIFAVIGVLYFPMALLGVAMYDSAAGVNPVIIVPAIFKVPLQYLLIVVLVGIMYMIRHFLDLMVDMLPGLLMKVIVFLPVEVVVFYTLIVTGRLLGLLYAANRQKFAWFD
jgi:hypothetical protein